MYILKNGVRKIESKSFIKQIFCKHEYIKGEICSSNGLIRISGQDFITVCNKCGKVKDKYRLEY